ncbi:MAG: glycosyltransferase family 2 protein [Nitrospirae bacterium]|nr:glycosyltransferase family 2 protein [Nitrospirota bacterium]
MSAALRERTFAFADRVLAERLTVIGVTSKVAPASMNLPNRTDSESPGPETDSFWAFLFKAPCAIFLLWLRLGLAIVSAAGSSPYAPKISIVVAARNEAKNIANLLAALRNQDYPQRDVEIIVVDDGSTERNPRRFQEARR